MKRINLIPEIIFMSLFLMVGITACQKENNGLTDCTYQSSARMSSLCGTPESFNIIKQNQTAVLGSMEISNDANFVYVTINSPGGLNATRLYYGACNSVPSNPSHYGNLVTLSGQNTYTYTIAKSAVDSCGCYAARVETNGVGLVTANYCLQPCPECEILPGDFKTYGQGGYGSTPQGNNPGMYLLNNFSAAFPGGIQVGCNYTLEFTSAADIMNFLPQGTTPASLVSSYINSTSQITVLAGQVLTLALNIGFDNYDASFGNSSDKLEDLVIASGDFSGMSVGQILAEANSVLGGCASVYSASQINDIVTEINENFEDGEVAGSLLTCP